MLLQVAAGNRLREDTAALNMTYTASVTAVEIDTPSASHGSTCATFDPPVSIQDSLTTERRSLSSPRTNAMRVTAVGQLHVYPKEAMHKTILLVSRDEALRTTRATILEKARHPTIQASRMQSALQLAAYCQLAVIDAPFSIVEHDEFIDGIRDQDNHACVLCICSGLTHPISLLDAVQDCLSRRIASRVCVIEGGNLIQPTN